MQKEFSRRDFLKGMAVVTASGLLVACGGGNGTPVKLAFVAMDNFYDQAETQNENGYVLCQGFQVKNLSASDITLDGLLDFKTYDKKESKVGVEKAIRELAGSSKTITAKTSAGAVTSIAVLDPASSKTLKPGESAIGLVLLPLRPPMRQRWISCIRGCTSAISVMEKIYPRMNLAVVAAVRPVVQ